MIPPYSQDGDGKLVWKNVHGGMMCLLLDIAAARTAKTEVMGVAVASRLLPLHSSPTFIRQECLNHRT
ncbi:MAG: hypothetical protein DMG08_14750 [Acidobacteria bacterium]|nr:MAG: hypothetical protein DMG08_14750 [Acidobacteriota bacterium]